MTPSHLYTPRHEPRFHLVTAHPLEPLHLARHLTSSKLSIPHWNDLIEGFDICISQETWSLVPLYKTGFVCFHSPVTTIGRGRPSGGLIIWVKIALGCRITCQTSSSPDILGLSIRGPRWGATFDLFNVYARGTKGGRPSPTISALEECLVSCSPHARVVIAGDFNCTFEQLDRDDLVGIEDDDNNWAIPPLNLPQSKDRHSQRFYLLPLPKSSA